MIVLVCGSRTFPNWELVYQYLDDVMPHKIVAGDATGADAAAHQWAHNEGRDAFLHKADWESHGKSAGPIRNQKMLDSHDVDLVLAFIDKPLEESRGTLDMVRRATQAGKHTRVISLMESEFNKKS